MKKLILYKIYVLRNIAILHVCCLIWICWSLSNVNLSFIIITHIKQIITKAYFTLHHFFQLSFLFSTVLCFFFASWSTIMFSVLPSWFLFLHLVVVPPSYFLFLHHVFCSSILFSVPPSCFCSSILFSVPPSWFLFLHLVFVPPSCFLFLHLVFCSSILFSVPPSCFLFLYCFSVPWFWFLFLFLSQVMNIWSC